VPEKNGEDQLELSCEKRSITKSRRGEERRTNNKKEGRPTGLVTSCLGTTLQNIIEGKIEGRMTGRRGIKRKQLPYDLK
jgi:hypothetical protein